MEDQPGLSQVLLVNPAVHQIGTDPHRTTPLMNAADDTWHDAGLPYVTSIQEKALDRASNRDHWDNH